MLSVIDFIHTSRDRYINELKQYLAIPSISALPERIGDVKRCAEWTAEEMRRIGLEWSWRLLREPRRLGRRYLIEDVKFFPLVWRWKRSARH